ncbi:MAG: capsular polysaccharide biosynthesis protein [Sphingomonadales bacterium]|nr:capsular polysaccharide biosynthesis protein [Sphingomonadales bacterium]
MTGSRDKETAAGDSLRRLFHANAGFLWQPRLRAILRAAGWDLRFAPLQGHPGPGDAVAVWGRSPYAARGEALATARGAPLLRLEDAFLRSVRPGRARRAGGPLGLLIDPEGVHFDSSRPSLIERLAARAPLDDHVLLQRARDGIGRLKALHLSKYNNFDPGLAPPAPGYVLVIDQSRYDASIRHGGASAATFREMLAVAQIENPGARIVIKTHPETAAGLRPGHYGPEHCDARTSLLGDPVSPWALLEVAVAVYSVSSLMGFEAVLAGHKPRIFGQPFYAGWGLTQDENPVARRERRLTRAQLFAVSHILAPTWFDPCRGRLCSFEEAVDQLEAEVRAFRADRAGHVATGMRLWKRRPLARVFGQTVPLRFAEPPARAARIATASGRNLLIWAGKEPPGLSAPAILRVEDGFLRSRGLGADLVPPLSLVTDRQGIYYDPTRPSEIEGLIAAEPPPGGRARAERLIAAIRRAELSKYNLGGALPALPDGHRILVAGQVEDDASIRLGAGEICTNRTLLARCRAENPGAVILFKPHPDVEAGLRPGHLPEAEARAFADAVVAKANPTALIAAVNEVWTMTSLLGFEALLRGKPVTVTGAPFYAGWGLTRDLGQPPARRQARPDLVQLAHAALIAYPRYFDPVSGRPCPPEVVVERLAEATLPRPGPALRSLAKLQGIFASYAGLWR